MRHIKDTETFHYIFFVHGATLTWMLATLAFLSWKYWFHASIRQIYSSNSHSLVRHVRHVKHLRGAYISYYEGTSAAAAVSLCRAVGLLA